MKNLLIIFLSLILVSCQIDQLEDLVISNTNIIDIKTGEVYTGDVLIRDSLIVNILGPHTLSVNTNNFIDGTGQYLIPGLWDMHVHIQDSTYLSMFLDYGITGVRDMGGCVNIPTDGCESVCPGILDQWKVAINQGEITGPHLFIAGTHLSGTGWPTSFSVSNKEEIALAFQNNIKDGVDFIKVYENISWESYQEIARLAKLNNLDFVGHVSDPLLLSDILDLGQKSIEHVREPIFYSFTKDSVELDSFMVADNYSVEAREYVQPWIDDAENVIESFKRNRAWVTPTMAVEFARQRYNDTVWIQHPLRDKLPESVNQGLNSHINAMKLNANRNSDELWWMGVKKLVKRLSEEKIGILAGSDAACEGGIPGYSLHEELFLMVEDAGLSPLEAMQTATINPCSYFSLKKNGKVHEGYHADLVLLKENPLKNIRNTLTIKAVIKHGKIVRLN